MDAATAYAQNTGTSFLRHVALSSNATVYAANNMGMIFNNYNANTMTMNGYTVTYDGVEAVDGGRLAVVLRRNDGGADDGDC